MVELELFGFWGAIAAYAVSFVLGAFALVLSRARWLTASMVAMAAGALFQTASLAGRGVAQWSPPLISYYESVCFGTWLAALILTIAWLRARQLAPAAVAVGPINLLLMGSAVFTSREFEPLAPALQSWWLVVHVVFAMLAFACMAVAAGAAFLRITFPRSSLLPAPVVVDRFLFRSVALTFMFQLVMVISGSIWANQAWGRFWGWDPIETFSLFTLLLFGAALHLYLALGWRGKRLSWIVLAGFLCTVYGIWGVPFFQPSVHLYQGPGR